MMPFPTPPLPPGASPEEVANYMQRKHDDGLPIWLFIFTGLALVAIAVFFAYGMGQTDGKLEAYKAERYACLKHEDRMFAGGGFLIVGRREITVENVCVEWRVTR